MRTFSSRTFWLEKADALDNPGIGIFLVTMFLLVSVIVFSRWSWVFFLAGAVSPLYFLFSNKSEIGKHYCFVGDNSSYLFYIDSDRAWMVSDLELAKAWELRGQSVGEISRTSKLCISGEAELSFQGHLRALARHRAGGHSAAIGKIPAEVYAEIANNCIEGRHAVLYRSRLVGIVNAICLASLFIGLAMSIQLNRLGLASFGEEQCIHFALAAASVVAIGWLVARATVVRKQDYVIITDEASFVLYATHKWACMMDLHEIEGCELGEGFLAIALSNGKHILSCSEESGKILRRIVMRAQEGSRVG